MGSELSEISLNVNCVALTPYALYQQNTIKEGIAMNKVRCVVVADSPYQESIAIVAKKAAAKNPAGRAVVLPGEAGYPGAQQIKDWLAAEGVASPGAIVLCVDGSVYRVLDIDKAQAEIVVDYCFAQASA